MVRVRIPPLPFVPGRCTVSHVTRHIVTGKEARFPGRSGTVFAGVVKLAKASGLGPEDFGGSSPLTRTEI
jgi:hypothetical protein